MITVKEKGSFSNVERYLERLKTDDLYAVLNKYGAIGVHALSSATPVDTGESANSWFYTIQHKKGYYSIRWHNSNIQNGTPIVVLLQYGHGTRSGSFVQGRDFIMPAIQPVFDQIAAEAWKEVTKV